MYCYSFTVRIGGSSRFFLVSRKKSEKGKPTMHPELVLSPSAVLIYGAAQVSHEHPAAWRRFVFEQHEAQAHPEAWRCWTSAVGVLPYDRRAEAPPPTEQARQAHPLPWPRTAAMVALVARPLVPHAEHGHPGR
jgi:hypothetical protein